LCKWCKIPEISVSHIPLNQGLEWGWIHCISLNQDKLVEKYNQKQPILVWILFHWLKVWLLKVWRKSIYSHSIQFFLRVIEQLQKPSCICPSEYAILWDYLWVLIGWKTPYFLDCIYFIDWASRNHSSTNLDGQISSMNFCYLTYRHVLLIGQPHSSIEKVIPSFYSCFWQVDAGIMILSKFQCTIQFNPNWWLRSTNRYNHSFMLRCWRYAFTTYIHKSQVIHCLIMNGTSN
jgi:hypothetical protein